MMDSKFKKNIERALSAYPKVFLPQEKVLAFAHPVVITESRLLQLGITGKILIEIRLEDVKEFSTSKKTLAKTGPLYVETNDGKKQKLGLVFDAQYQEFQRVLVMIQAGEIPEYIEAPAMKETIEALAILEGPVVPTKKEEIEALAEQRVVREAPPHYGTVVANESFGLYKVRIFSDGYIQISKGLGLFKGSIEKLLEIEGESQITKKSALGRGLAGVVTLGKNQLAPNQRGNLIMTITTDKVVHVLIEDLPQKQWIVSMNKLVAVGKSVIKKGAAPEATSTAKDSSQSQSLAQQIRELSELKDAGVITEKEFESAKQKLLS
jgi:hypothetical protein